METNKKCHDCHVPIEIVGDEIKNGVLLSYKEGDKEHHGKQAPVSYTNFYIGNKTVLVSIFNDENDEQAISIIKSCFPDRKIVGINCTDIIYGGGSLHCMTQQEPAI